MNDLRFEEINHSLLEVLPELEERYKQGLSWWQGPEPPGQYIVFGFVAKPALWELLSSGSDPAFLKRIFSFFEGMARSSDIHVVNLLQVGVLEGLVGERDRLTAAWGYMGEGSKKLARETARIRRCEENLPPEK